MRNVREVSVSKTAAAAFRSMVHGGFQWKDTSIHDDLGEVTVYGVHVPALDATGMPTNFIAPWVVAAEWPGIDLLPGQQMLNLLRDVQFAGSAIYCRFAWQLDRRDCEWFVNEVDGIRGTFSVHRLRAPSVFCVAHQDWRR